MAKKRPQLETDDLRQAKWLLGNVLALVSLSALLYLDAATWWLLAAGAVLVAAMLVKPAWPARVPLWAHRLVFPVVAAVFTFDLYAGGEPLSAMVRLDTMLLVYRSCHYRKRRDDLQLLVLGLFLVVMAGVVTSSMAFAIQIVAFVGLSLLLLFVLTLLGPDEAPETSSGGVPAWSRRSVADLARRLGASCDSRVVALGVLLFAGFVTVSGGLFLAIPRFQLDNGFAFDRLMPKKSTTGFSDVLHFDDVTDIQQDTGVALRIEPAERSALPDMPYWRVVVLDEYKDGAFRMSATLKRAMFRRPMTVRTIHGSEPLRGDAAAWTFYLEPGASRYLPMGAGFARLTFAEPQSCQWSNRLRLIALDREANAMKAYRIEGLKLADRIADRMPPSGFDEGDVREALLKTGVEEADQAALEQTAREIGAGQGVSAEIFAQNAMRWLAARHGYSLKSTLPSGKGDPLVRWLQSKEPGHCEYFAGAFTLLARAAGYPVRVVSGFMGGEWNDDYLIVRNSDAHAWCEIYSEKGRWVRVDPTNDGPRLLRESEANEQVRVVRTAARGWGSRLDRLRMLWYRRVVSFDQADQRELVRSVREVTEEWGQQLRASAARMAKAFALWRTSPWDARRLAKAGALGLVGAALLYVIVRYGPRWRLRGRKEGGVRLEPVRSEAGRWLRRGALGQGDELLMAKLHRLRYGPRETWPEPGPVFREARSAWKRSRR